MAWSTDKALTAIYNGVTLTAGASDNISSAVDLSAADGAGLHIKLTNGTTGPTVAAQCQIETSADNSEWYEFGGALVGGTANSTVYSWGNIAIGQGAEYVRLRAGSNTGQNVTIDADISVVTRST